MPERCRGDDFLFLAAALACPSKPFLRLLRGDAAVPGGGRWLSGYPTDSALLEVLREEHTRLFVNAFPRLAAPPYATAYQASDTSETLLTQIADRLARCRLVIKTAGWRLDDLRLLLEAAGRITSVEERGRFVADFLVPWLPRYGQRLRGVARLPLYPGLVSAAQALAIACVKDVHREA